MAPIGLGQISREGGCPSEPEAMLVRLVVMECGQAAGLPMLEL